MIHYLLVRANGAVAQRGSCNTEAEIPVMPGCTSVLIEPEDSRRPKQRARTYRETRQLGYPSLGDQLEAIWQMLDTAGLVTGEAAVILAKIKAVKLANPKP